MTTRRTCASAVCLAAALWIGCTDVGDYSTDKGECYEGEIVDAEFVRVGFEKGVKIEMTLDADALGRGDADAAILTTSDGRFSKTPSTQMEEISHDSLSMLQFPGGRVRNYLAFAEPDKKGSAVVVISLMENEDIEVRILRPGASDTDSDSDSDSDNDVRLFAVFRLVRKEGCDTE